MSGAGVKILDHRPMLYLSFMSVIASGLAFLAYAADPFVFRLCMIVGAFWICLPVCVGCVLALLIALVARKSGRLPLSIMKYTISAFLLGSAAAQLNAFIFSRAEEEAKAYPEKILPLLESYHKQHGRYPSSLDVLDGKPAIPRLLRVPDAYKSDGKTFSFSFPKPGGLMDFWHFQSETREWKFIS